MNDHYPLVSVIVVVRNEIKFISETLESITSQDYPNLEIFVQDGCSTDGTIDILKKTKVKWISEPDSGMANAANKAANYTNGEFIIFEGGDDLLKPNAIKIMAEVLKNNPNINFVYSDIDIIDHESKPYYHLKGKTFDFDELFIYNFIPSQSVLLRRKAFEEVGGFDESLIIADWDIRIKMGARGSSMYIPQTLASYRIHNNSTTLNNFNKVALELYSLPSGLLKDENILKAFKKNPKRGLAGACILSSLSYMRGGSLLRSIKMYLKALKAY